MVLGAKALAFLRGRDYALPADVRELARDVLRHRVVLSYEALADDVVARRRARPAAGRDPAPRARQPGSTHAGPDDAGGPRRTRRPARRPSRAPAVTELAALTPERVLRRLEWRVLRRLDGRLQGDYRTVFRGTGVDVADLREYQFGDDLRHVDWNVTARTDTPHVREYLEDREVTAWLLLDLSASMDFGPVAAAQARRADRGRGHAWRSCSRAAATGSARCCSTPRLRETIPPASGRNQVLRILARLLRPAAAGTGDHRPRRRAARRARDPAAPVARRDRLGLPRPSRAGRGCWASSRAGTTWWRSRWWTGASSTSPPPG